MATAKNAPKKAPVFRFDYVTSTVSLLVQGGQGDGIVVHVLNDSAAPQHAQAIVYHNSGAGAVVATNSGPVVVTPNWQWSLGFTISTSGEYWVRVSATSDVLVPKVSFERWTSGLWTPVVSYRPGDFAVFRLTPTRQRLW